MAKHQHCIKNPNDEIIVDSVAALQSATTSTPLTFVPGSSATLRLILAVTSSPGMIGDR